jgi:hypothetical protein
MKSALNVQHSRILKRLDPKLYCLLPSVIVPTQSMTKLAAAPEEGALLKFQ